MNTDYGNQITKDTLRQIYDSLAPSRENEATLAAIAAILAKKTITPVPYSYNAIFWVTGANNALAAGATALVTVGIQADADFLILNQTYNANTANAAVTESSFPYPNVTALLLDTGSGFQMMDQPTPITSIFGNGQFPYYLPQPKLMPAKSALQVTLTNYDAAAGYNIRLSFNGVKLYASN